VRRRADGGKKAARQLIAAGRGRVVEAHDMLLVSVAFRSGPTVAIREFESFSELLLDGSQIEWLRTSAIGGSLD